MKLSIVIPTKNSAATIHPCLDSIYRTGANVGEVLIIDSCSDDATCVEVEKWKSRLPLRMVSEADAGVYDAFNKGARLSQGDFVYFMGADDYLLPGFLGALSQLENTNTIYVGRIRTGDIIEAWQPGPGGIRLLYRNIPHQAMIIPRQILMMYPYDLRYRILADYAWNLRMYWNTSSRMNYHIHDFLMCNWSPGGLSQRTLDSAFKADKGTIVAENAPAAVNFLFKAWRLINRWRPSHVF